MDLETMSKYLEPMLQSQTNVSVCVLVVASLVSPELNLHEHGYPHKAEFVTTLLSVDFPFMSFFLTLHLIITKFSTSQLSSFNCAIEWSTHLTSELMDILYIWPSDKPTTTIVLAWHRWLFEAWSGQSRGLRPGWWPLSLRRD
jgi:hypothetical protein